MKSKILIIFLCTFSLKIHCETNETTRMLLNKMMMEDKKMVGVQANYIIPVGALGKDISGALGGGVRGKYFGTNTFAFGFDLSFFAPKMKDDALTFAKDSTFGNKLRDMQRKNLIADSIQIINVTGRSQYIPFNLSFEFYLPSKSMTNFRPYASLGIGLNIINRYYDVEYNVPMTTQLQMMQDEVQPSSSKGYFSLNPGIGFLATIDELWNINCDLRYNFLFGEQKGGSLSFNIGVILDLSFKYVR